MSKIKHTKNELKAQRDALARFERFLPMLQLKKQQLQIEIHSLDIKIAGKTAEERKIQSYLQQWKKLFAQPSQNGIQDLISLESVITEEGNIAGVSILILKEVGIKKKEYDLFTTPPWFDDALDVLEKLMRLRIEREIIEEQRRLISEELRITTQRVNLFEKVKIPETRENIRVIKIFLGDQQTAAVIRAKIAKDRTLVYEYEEA